MKIFMYFVPNIIKAATLGALRPLMPLKPLRQPLKEVLPFQIIGILGKLLHRQQHQQLGGEDS